VHLIIVFEDIVGRRSSKHNMDALQHLLHDWATAEEADTLLFCCHKARQAMAAPSGNRQAHARRL
jgi:hypothetical protein